MVPFKEHLYEATLFAFGRILSRYNAFAQGLILKEAGREILEYLKRQGYEFPKTDSIDGVLKVIDVFANNGFVENLEVEEAGEETKFTWHNLYGFEAYRELQETTENPFLSCPLNAVLWYLADALGKTLKLRDKRFIEEGRTAVSVEQFVDKDAEAALEQDGFDPLVLENTKLLELAERRADKLEKILKELKTLQGLLPICVNCKKIRDDQGYWKRLEHYLQEHSEATFSHGLCPDCLKELYPELAEAIMTEAEEGGAEI